MPLLHQDGLLSAKVPLTVTLTNGCGLSTGGPNPTVYIYVALTHKQALYIQSPQHSPYHEVSGKSRIDTRMSAIWRRAERDACLRNMFSAVYYSIGLNFHLLQIKIHCHKAYHTAHCHIILLYLTVLISIYCRYKSTVTKLITLQTSHCTLSYNIVISHCTDLHLLQIQIYCHKANHTTDITLHTVI